MAGELHFPDPTSCHASTPASSRPGHSKPGRLEARDLSFPRIQYDNVTGAKYFQPPPSDYNGRSLIRPYPNPIRVVEHEADKSIEPLPLEKMRVEK